MPEIDSQTHPTLARGTRLTIDKVTGQPVLLFPEGVVQLNSTTEAILLRCNGQTTAEQIVASLAEEYEADPEALRGDVLQCLNQFQQRKLIVLV